MSRLIQTLPQELFNEIYEHFVSIIPAEVTINNHYRPPNELRVDSIARASYASVYYSSTMFTSDDIGCLVAWLASLQPDHFAMLSFLRYENTHSRTARRSRQDEGSVVMLDLYYPSSLIGSGW